MVVPAKALRLNLLGPAVLVLPAPASRVPPEAFIGVLLAAGLLLLIWWFTDRRVEKKRAALRRLYSLGEKMTARRPMLEHLKTLQASLPEILEVTGVKLFLHDRASKVLRPVEETTGPGPVPLLTDDPVGPLEKAVASCYRNRSLLVIPDTRRSPFFEGTDDAGLPRSVLVVPMFAQGDLAGILEIDHASKARNFSQDEETMAQHLANQLAIGMKLQERQTIRERLFRTDRPATGGKLISNVATELKAPLEVIAESAQSALDRTGGDDPEAELRTISIEARKASKIAAQLLSITRADEDETAPFDLNLLLRDLLRSRDQAWREHKIQFEDLLPMQPVFVEGSTTRLAQVFLSLLAHAERSVAEVEQKAVSLRTYTLGGCVEVEITYTATEAADGPDPLGKEAKKPAEDSLSPAVCRSILRSHGGDLRLIRVSDHALRLEAELPAADAPATEPAATSSLASKAVQPLTTLLVEPEPAEQRRMLTLLSDRGHRSVAAGSGEEAAHLAGQLHFHITFCSTRLPGMSWIEVFEKTRSLVNAFVLLTEGYEADPAGALPGEDGYALSKPVQSSELARVLGLIESRLGAGAR